MVEQLEHRCITWEKVWDLGMIPCSVDVGLATFIDCLASPSWFILSNFIAPGRMFLSLSVFLKLVFC